MKRLMTRMWMIGFLMLAACCLLLAGCQTAAPDQDEAAKVAARIAARHLLADKPEAVVVLRDVCAATDQAEAPADLSDLVMAVIERHSDLFEDDPLLRADLLDLFDLMGLSAPPVAGEMPPRPPALDAVCGLVR